MSCNWPIDEACLPALPTLGDTPTDAELVAFDAATDARKDAEAVAVQIMWALSGRQFGICEYLIRPLTSATMCDPAAALPQLASQGEGRTWIRLPGPAAGIVEVRVAGALIDPSAYVLEGDRLYRVGGHSWPAQNMARPEGEPGTWSVLYLRGLPVPPGVDRLTGLLAKELIAACDGGKCRLPRTVVSTTQRGVTHVFDPSKILAAGKTGIPEIDVWLAAVNPHQLLAAPVVV